MIREKRSHSSVNSPLCSRSSLGRARSAGTLWFAGCLILFNIYQLALTPSSLAQEAVPPAAPVDPVGVAGDSSAADPSGAQSAPTGQSSGEGNEQLDDSPQFSSARVKITLKQAFERMKNGNRDIKNGAIDLRVAELDYETAFHTMFIPEFTVGVTGMAANYTVGQFPSADGSDTGRETYSSGVIPSTTVLMNLGSYNLFNGWKDWSAWQKAKILWQGAKSTYESLVRGIRTDVFSQFYSLKIAQEKLETAEQSRDLAKTILELRKAERAVGKSNEDELSTAEADLARAQDSVREQQAALREGSLMMNQLLGDPIGTLYEVEGKVPEFVSVDMTADQAFRIFMEHSIEIRDYKSTLQGQEISYQAAERSRLPAATVSFSGLQIAANQGIFGSTPPGLGTTSTDSANWEFGLAVSLSIPLYTKDGFMLGRTVERERLKLEKEKMSYTDQLMEARRTVFNQLANLKQSEQELENKKQVSSEADKVLGRLANRMRTESLNRLELRDALSTARDAAVDYLDARINYIKSKIEFANLIGLEFLPGEPLR